MKKLIAYFSASGTTKKAAEQLAEIAGADLYEIKPAIPYTVGDLNWLSKKSRSSVEMNDPASRPELAEPAPDMADYDMIYIGFPIWWYTAPHIINSFIESADLTGKQVALFATSGGTGIKKAVSDLAEAYPGLDIVGGTRVRGRVTEDII